MRKKFRITLDLTVDTDKWDPPGEWNWKNILLDNFNPDDNHDPIVIASEELPGEEEVIDPSRN